MGVGDWLIATGQVKQMYEASPIPVVVIGIDGKPQWSEVFENNPKILKFKIKGKSQILINGPGARPYIAGKSPDRWLWKPFKAVPGELYFSKQELDFGARWGCGGILIEPNIKKNASPNKAWSFDRWQELVNRMTDKNTRFVQCGNPNTTKWLQNVSRVATPTFRHACAVLDHCKTLVTSEGGLMHAAAALNKPSVILWSEFIDPTITGYEMHVNIRHANRTCGMRVPCSTCKNSMDAIEVKEVEDKLRSLL